MKIRSQIDLLFGGILLAVLITTLAPAGSTLLGPTSGLDSPFPVALSVVRDITPLEPSPEVFRSMRTFSRVVVGQHEVRSKDTLSLLAKEYGSTVDSLRSTNRLDSLTSLVERKTVLVHNGNGMLHQVREIKGQPESLRAIARRYNQPELKIVQANRLPGVSLLSTKWLTPGRLLFIPDARLRFSDYILPVGWSGGKRFISSGFGYRRHPIFRDKRFHKGWDMPRPYGTPVQSVREGRVIFTGWHGALGNCIIVKHAGGLRTWYGHLSKIKVENGQLVKKGQTLGSVGSSGWATGPHLHFEVRDAFGRSLNPRKYLFK